MASSPAWSAAGGRGAQPPPHEQHVRAPSSQGSRTANGSMPRYGGRPEDPPPYLSQGGGAGFARQPPPNDHDFRYGRPLDPHSGGGGGGVGGASGTEGPAPRRGQGQERVFFPSSAAPLAYAPSAPLFVSAGPVANAYALGASNPPYYGGNAGGAAQNRGVSRFSSATTVSRLDPYFEEYQREYYRLARERKVTNTAPVANNYQPAVPARPAAARPQAAGSAQPPARSGTTWVNAPSNAFAGGAPSDRDAVRMANERDSQSIGASFQDTTRESMSPLSLGHQEGSERPSQTNPTRPKLTMPSPSQLRRPSKGGSAPYQRLDNPDAGADDAGDLKSEAASRRRRSYCNRPCCCPCCPCCSNAVGCGLCGLMLVLIVGAAAVTLYMLFPGLPSVTVAGVDLAGDIFFGKSVTPFSLVSGGGGLVKADASDPDATKVKLPLAIKIDVKSRFRVAVNVNNITVTGYVPLPKQAKNAGQAVQIGFGGLTQAVTFPPESTKSVVLRFTMEYDTADPTGASLMAVRDLFDACGVIASGSTRPIVLDYRVGVDLPFLSWTGFVPSFNSSTSFNCPWKPDEIANKISSLEDLADVPA